MGFETKKALLEYLGKNVNDNKLVDRLILRGEVEVRDGLYYVVDKDEEIKELKEKIIFLENQQGKNTLDELTEQYKEAKAQWDYWEAKCRRYGKYMLKVIEVTYNRIKPLCGNRLEPYEEFKEHILEEVREICWKDE